MILSHGICWKKGNVTGLEIVVDRRSDLGVERVDNIVTLVVDGREGNEPPLRAMARQYLADHPEIKPGTCDAKGRKERAKGRVKQREQIRNAVTERWGKIQEFQKAREEERNLAKDVHRKRAEKQDLKPAKEMRDAKREELKRLESESWK